MPDTEVLLIEHDASVAVETLIAEVERFAPDVIGASAYVWSFPRLLEVARHVRRSRPEVPIIFGGPSARPAMFELAPFRERRFDVDALVVGEGEHVFANLVAAHTRDVAALGAIAGLALPTAEGFRHTAEARFIDPLDSVASPYVLGLVPEGLNGHIETFRGCPLKCSFCQWGATESGSRIFSQEYLARELRAMRASTHRSAMIVDAALNLNPRAFRNLVAAEAETSVLAEIGLGFEIYPSHLHEEHLRFLERIRVATIGVGLQSFDREVLRKVQRPFDEHRFERVVRELSMFDTTVVIELIMGLPHDTADSFLRTFERALSLPCHVRVFRCLVLPDALMTRAPEGSRLEFDPHTLQVQSCAGWTREDLERTAAMLDALPNRILCHGDGEGVWFFSGALDTERALRPTKRGVTPGQAAPEMPSVVLLAGDALSRIDHAMASATRGRIRVKTVERSSNLVSIELTIDAEQVTLDLSPATDDGAAFARVDGVAVVHRGMPNDATIHALTAVVPKLGGLFRRLLDLSPQHRSLPLLS